MFTNTTNAELDKAIQYCLDVDEFDLVAEIVHDKLQSPPKPAPQLVRPPLPVMTPKPELGLAPVPTPHQYRGPTTILIPICALVACPLGCGALLPPQGVHKSCNDCNDPRQNFVTYSAVNKLT